MWQGCAAVTLSPHNKRDPWFDSRLGNFALWSLFVLPLFGIGLLRVLHFLPIAKSMECSKTGTGQTSQCYKYSFKLINWGYTGTILTVTAKKLEGPSEKKY